MTCRGMRVGDVVLVELANRLKGELRMEDTVARLGGDEFAIIHTGSNNADEPGRPCPAHSSHGQQTVPG